MINEFAKFLQSKTSFITGSTIQVGFRPQSAPDRCHVVLESGGGSLYFDLPNRVDKMFQIISRSTTYHTARADAREIFDAIHGTAGWTLPVVDNAYVAMIIEAISDPQYIGQDEKGRFEFSTNYMVKIRDA